MRVRTPLVEAEQDGSIRIQNLTKVVMARRRLGLAEERLVPFEATGNVADADDCPRAFHRSSAVGLTTRAQRPSPQEAWIATEAHWPGLLQRIVRPHCLLACWILFKLW